MLKASKKQRKIQEVTMLALKPFRITGTGNGRVGS